MVSGQRWCASCNFTYKKLGKIFMNTYVENWRIHTTYVVICYHKKNPLHIYISIYLFQVQIQLYIQSELISQLQK